jgi:type I restriction enzyme S subunit
MKDSGVSWIGMMPKHWKHFQLKNAAILKTGHTPPTVDVCNFGGDINWYTPGDFTSDTVSDSLRTITEYALVNEGITVFPKNTTLLIGIGGTAGKVCKITVPGYSNQQITAIIANCDVNPDFLFYEMIVAKQYLKDNAMYTTLPIINNGYLGSLRFILPTTVEQKEIVEYLDNKCSKIDKLIEIKQSKIAKLNEYKKSLIYEYVTGKKEA